MTEMATEQQQEEATIVYIQQSVEPQMQHAEPQQNQYSQHSSQQQQQTVHQYTEQKHSQQPEQSQQALEYSENARILAVNKDIYNTYAILKAKTILIKTSQSTIWESQLTTMDKILFYFFLALIFMIQIGGFYVLWMDADEIAQQMKKAATDGTQVFFNDGFIEFISANNQSALLFDSNRLNISYASVNLLDTNPRVPVSDIDYSVLFAILVADICMVLTLFKHLSQMGGLMILTSYLSDFHQKKKLVKWLLRTKIVILLLGSLASLNIIALATTSIEAVEKAVAVFFLLETSSWIYALIRQHPAIDDSLYETVIDLSQTIPMEDGKANDQQPAAASDGTQNFDDWIKECEMYEYERIQEENALLNVFVMTIAFSVLYIGIQFTWQLNYGTFGGSMIAIGCLCTVIKVILNQKAKHEAAARVQSEMVRSQIAVNQ